MDPSQQAPLDREKYRPKSNPNRFDSFRSALAGLVYLLRYEQSIRLLLVYTVLVIGLALWLEVDRLAIVELIIAIGAVWITECLNTSLEAAVDLAMPDLHPLAKIAKDVGGTATFLSAALSLLVSVVVLGTPLLERLNG